MTAVLQRFTINDLRLTIFKLALAFFLFSLSSFLFSSNAFAQTPSQGTVKSEKNIVQNQNPPSSSLLSPPSSYIPSQSPHTASMAIYNFSHAMSCILIGQSPIAPCLEYRMVKDATGAVRSVPYLSQVNTSNGVLGMSLSMIGEVIGNPPIHSSLFLANLGEQIGIKSAHAQVSGSGSGVLAPIFKLWEVSRNISYLAMILIFIIVGLMVMFRQKLNPQTVVSIQMALPGLVIGLVMITFSYFLASLISDFAFIGTNLVGYYFSLAQGGTGPLQPPLINPSGKEENILNIFSKYTGILNQETISRALSASVWNNINDEIGRLLTTLSAAFVYQITNQATSIASSIPKIGDFIKQTLSGAAALKALSDPSGMTGFALSWIAGIILIYSMFKLLFKLIMNLLNIIFLTISAPFQFLAASLPGKQEIATKWFFNMLCNILVFPAIVGVFYFVAFILGVNDPTLPLPRGGIAPVSLGNTSTFPLLGGLDLGFLNLLLAFGALVASPSIPDVICKTVGKQGGAGGLLAGAVGGAMASGQRYSGQFGQGAGNVGERMGGLWNKRAMAQVKSQEDAIRLGLPHAAEWNKINKSTGKPYSALYQDRYFPTNLSYYGGQLGGAQKAWEISKGMRGIGLGARWLGDKGTALRGAVGSGAKAAAGPFRRKSP